MTSRSKKSSTEKLPGVAELEKRIAQLEELIMRSLKPVSLMESAKKSIDMSPYMTFREKTPFLQNLYPGREDGSRIYVPSEMDVGLNCSGYWPGGRQWLGLYLGGIDSMNETRRAITIPMCLGNGLPFFCPLGLSTNASDMSVRLEALNSCASAIIDFSGDDNLTGYLAGFELMYLFAQGFVNVSLVGLPTNIVTQCMRFDEVEKSMNLCGPHLATSVRRRRQDYYNIMRILTDAMESWTEYSQFQGPGGLDQVVVNFRANFVKPHADGVQISVLDRLGIVRSLGRYETDIGECLRIVLSMLLLAEMRTKEFMETNMGSEWAFVRSEYANLQLRAEKASLILSDSDTIDERTLHLQNFIDLIAMTDAALTGHRHLQ